MKNNIPNKNIELKEIKTDEICPIGYKRNPLTNALEIDEIKAPQIMKMFNSLVYDELLSDEELVYMLISLGRDGIITVCSIMHSTFYCGYIEKNGRLYEGSHPKLISIETWLKANERFLKILDSTLKILTLEGNN